MKQFLQMMGFEPILRKEAKCFLSEERRAFFRKDGKVLCGYQSWIPLLTMPLYICDMYEYYYHLTVINIFSVFSHLSFSSPHSSLLRLAGQDLLFPFERSGNWGSEGCHHLLKVTKQWLGLLPADPQAKLFKIYIYMTKRVIISKCNSDMSYLYLKFFIGSLALVTDAVLHPCVWNTNS